MPQLPPPGLGINSAAALPTEIDKRVLIVDIVGRVCCRFGRDRLTSIMCALVAVTMQSTKQSPPASFEINSAPAPPTDIDKRVVTEDIVGRVCFGFVRARSAVADTKVCVFG